jgi:hypothetical protein
VHAVVIRVTIDDFDRGRAFLTEQVVPRVSQAPGFVSGHWTRSDDSSNGLSMIIFESEEGARAVVDMIQSQGPGDGVTLEDVEVREVVASA